MLIELKEGRMPQVIKPGLKWPGNACDLMLYRFNKKEEINKLGPSTVAQVSFSKWTGRRINDIVSVPWTARKAHDVVCAHFNINEKWDKNCFKSVFVKDKSFCKEFDCFEFETAHQDIYGVSVYGDNELVCLKDSPEFYSLEGDGASNKAFSVCMEQLHEDGSVYLKKTYKFEQCEMLSVSMERFDKSGTLLMKKDYEFPFDGWESYKYNNFSVSALFNSKCFKRLTAYSTSLRISRTLEKLDSAQYCKKSKL
jgi:hypothetical protein